MRVFTDFCRASYKKREKPQNFIDYRLSTIDFQKNFIDFRLSMRVYERRRARKTPSPGGSGLLFLQSRMSYVIFYHLEGPKSGFFRFWSTICYPETRAGALLASCCVFLCAVVCLYLGDVKTLRTALNAFYGVGLFLGIKKPAHMEPVFYIFYYIAM